MSQHEYELSREEYKGFMLRIIQDSDVEEPDYGGDEIYLSAQSHRGCGSYRIGRKGEETSGERHMLWGTGKWGEFGSDIPEEAEPGESAAYDLYASWLDEYDPSYQVWPIRCGDAHGPGSFCIWEHGEDYEDSEGIEGFVYIRVPVTDIEKLGDADRDIEAMKDGIIETYRQWANGEVYGYEVLDSDEEVLESCWGYYGDDACMEEAKSMADYLAEKTKRSTRILVIRTDFTWEYLDVDIPMYVGEEHVVEWVRENHEIGQDDTVTECVVPREQGWLFENMRNEEGSEHGT